MQKTPTLSNHNITGSVIFIGIIFSALLILSNLVAFKLVTVAEFTFPAGLIFFPLTYVFDDILTEVYGFKISRRIIWAALCANLIVFLGTWITTFLPPSPNWHEQHAYEIVYRATPRVFIASFISYLFGEFTNSYILAKLKIFTQGRHLWLRALASSGAGVSIDTVLFSHIAFLFLVPYAAVWNIIFTMTLSKLIYETLALPFTYRIANYLKTKDQIDYYDYDTQFTPFSLKI